ncbi:MAG: TonB-dependent receptor, partial [Porticoccaceae bacterium]|nr:TonB-dependent receptor [Porticoccaceae bacterium]
MKTLATGNTQPRKAIAMVLLPLAGVVATGMAYAQPTLEEIIVTAQKRAQNLQDVPIAVTALQGEQLVSAGIDTQRALSMMTPNVIVNANADYVTPYIRGIGTQYANPGLEPSVGTYFNDVYNSRSSAGLMTFTDVERVEVLKGPQGTLYGRNTTGGAVRIITKDPTEEFEAGIGMNLGNYDQRGADFYISGPLAENLTGRLAGQIDKRDGYVDNIVGGEDFGDRDQYMLHGKLAWQATERLRVKLDLDYTEKEDKESTAFLPLFPGLPEQIGAAFGGVVAQDTHDSSSNMDQDNEYTAGGGQLRFDYDFDGFALSAVTGYRYSKWRGYADLDATSAPLFDVQSMVSKTENYSQEFQLVSTSDSKLQWQVGLYYFEEDSNQNFGLGGILIDADLGFPDAFVGGDGHADITSFAPYGQVSYDITDQWEILLGLRYTDETKKARNIFYITTVDGPANPVRPYLMSDHVKGQKVSFTELNPKVQITWRPTSNLMFYASYSEAFKSGGFNLPQPAPGLITEVEQETVESFEVGWKTEFNRVRFNGAIFHYELDDLQLQVTDIGGGITSVRNAGSAKIHGAEFDLYFAATEKLELGLGAGWQDSEFGKVPDGQYFVPCSQMAEFLA